MLTSAPGWTDAAARLGCSGGMTRSLPEVLCPCRTDATDRLGPGAAVLGMGAGALVLGPGGGNVCPGGRRGGGLGMAMFLGCKDCFWLGAAICLLGTPDCDADIVVDEGSSVDDLEPSASWSTELLGCGFGFKPKSRGSIRN